MELMVVHLWLSLFIRIGNVFISELEIINTSTMYLPALVYSSDREIEFPKFQFTNEESSRYKQLSKKFASINFSPDGEINREIEFPKKYDDYYD